MTEKKTVKLSDICILEKGQQIDTSLLDDSKPYRYINGGIKESGYFDNFNTSGESVLISEGGASCGYINYVNEDFWCGCHCYRLHDIKVSPKYLFHALKANQQRIMALRTGSAMPNIQKSTIQKFDLKIHDDLKIQQNISSMLDKCNVLIEKHKLILDKYDTLIKSRFIEMFGDPLENSKHWETKNLGNLCEIVRGGSPRPIDKYLGGNIPWIKIGDATNGDDIYLDKTKEYIIEEGIKKSRLIPEGSLIFANCGVSLGFARIIKFQGCIHDGWLAFQNIDKKLNNVFLLKSLNMCTDYFRKTAPDGTQPNLNTTIMKGFVQILPPINLQNEYVQFVEQIDKSKFVVQKSLEEAETLYKSLMQEYFG